MAAIVILGVPATGEVEATQNALAHNVTLTDATIFLLPIIATFVAWATMSYVITGQWLPGISSQYGTGTQTSEGAHLTFVLRAEHFLHNVEYLAPLLPVVSRRRRFSEACDIQDYPAPLAVLGGSIAFDTWACWWGSSSPGTAISS